MVVWNEKKELGAMYDRDGYVAECQRIDFKRLRGCDFCKHFTVHIDSPVKYIAVQSTDKIHSIGFFDVLRSVIGRINCYQVPSDVSTKKDIYIVPKGRTLTGFRSYYKQKKLIGV